MSEFSLIDQITKDFRIHDPSVLMGVGDDCAVWKEGKGLRVLTTDSMVEGDHFLKNWFTPEQVGHRFLMSNVSDVASMGAKPMFLFVALVLDDATSPEWVERLYNGMRPICEHHHISLLGGNVTHGKTLSLTATLLGESPDKVVYRNGAKIGDVLVVTGDTGSACVARLLLKSGHPPPSELFERLACPTARVAEGVFLKDYATSMIDISDGIASEARHLAEESGCGVHVVAEQIPLHPSALPFDGTLSATLIECALRGGEDYELMFTVSADRWHQLQQAWPFDTAITAIGVITSGHETLLIQNERTSPLPRGFDHLAENINL
jgi:thiamine-monophosphate kinase